MNYFYLVNLTLQAHEAAYDQARNSLDSTHPTRLSVALSYSNFCKDVLGDIDKARAIAKRVSQKF